MTDRMREAYKGYLIETYGYEEAEVCRRGDTLEPTDLATFQAGWQARDAEVAELVGALEEIANIKLTEPFDCQKTMIDEINARNAVEIAQAALAKHKQEG